MVKAMNSRSNILSLSGDLRDEALAPCSALPWANPYELPGTTVHGSETNGPKAT